MCEEGEGWGGWERGDRMRVQTAGNEVREMTELKAVLLNTTRAPL